MTEKEKMTAGKIYDPSDEELVKLRTKAHRLSKEYNELLETDEKRSEILKEMGIIGDSFYLQGPVQFDYGCLTSIGANSYANFNFTCVDCCPVTIGANVFMGPNVSLLTPMHPLRWQDRNQYQKQHGTPTASEFAGISLVTTLPAPITQPSPIVTPPQIVTFPAIQQLSPMVIGLAYSLSVSVPFCF